MSQKYSPHIHWLSLIETSGPFLSVSVLKDIFPQGLDVVETQLRQRIRAAYEEWRNEIENNTDDPLLPALHNEWIRMILTELLEYDEKSLVSINDLDGEEPYVSSIENIGKFSPEYIIHSPTSKENRMFITVLPCNTDFNSNKCDDDWAAPWYERMILLCRKYHVRLGMLTNGEQWMLINAPENSTSGKASWYSRLWLSEPDTQRAFRSLLSVRRCFGPPKETLESMLEASLEHYEEVTDTLGLQVRHAVEVLIQGLGKADEERNQELLQDVQASELYEAGLTIMMRLVFILCAEERGLLLLNETQYDECYAVSTLRGQLAEAADQHGEEVLERRHDAYARLLAIFRAIYSGIDHENLRLLALGGSLFDPDRFPFLEGRKKGTSWKKVSASPLPIDNRTVLLLLNSLQLLEQSGGALLLSYKALDVEQIGYVYEGLLEHTVIRSNGITLGLVGSKKAKNPNISLGDLESASLENETTLIDLIEQKTSRSKSAIKRDLTKPIDNELHGKIISSCRGDDKLVKRIKPFAWLLRKDAWGEPIVYPENAFMVTMGQDRRETGTHYTPRSFTETIVKTTLEPTVYVGPSEGIDQKEWKLKSSAEILDLKICDPAMGSGAFLVQVCRYLSEKLVEAWKQEELNGKYINEDGASCDDLGDNQPIATDSDDRLLAAKNLIAERCLYGVDINPLAVELAKVSIWLETLAKKRPFGFLDHNLRSGDSLLGLHEIKQLICLTMKPEEYKPRLFGSNIEALVNDAIVIRKQIRTVRIRDIHDIEKMQNMDIESRQLLSDVELLADSISGAALANSSNENAIVKSLDEIAIWASEIFDSHIDKSTNHRRYIPELQKFAAKSLSVDLPYDKPPRKPLHWVLNFPEVFESGGFDAIVGNPPFMGGQKISGNFGKNYLEYLKYAFTPAGAIDIVGFFFRRNFDLINKDRSFGCLSTNTIAQGETREGSLEVIEKQGGTIVMVVKSMPWPGAANVIVSITTLFKGKWCGICKLDGVEVSYVSSFFDTQLSSGNPYSLYQNLDKSFQGSIILGDGFILSIEKGNEMILKNPKNKNVIYPYINNEDLNSRPDQTPSRMVINFKDWPLNRENAKPNYYGSVAADYPDCLEIVEELVKPERLSTSCSDDKINEWWKYLRSRPALTKAIAMLDKVLVFGTQATKYLFFSFLSKDIIFSNAVGVISSDCEWFFTILSSDIHSVWAWKYSTTMKTDLRYTPTTAFQTFSFPSGLEPNNKNPSNSNMEKLDELGERLETSRKTIMTRLNIGLTKLYNLYHTKDLDIQAVMSVSNCDEKNAVWAVENIKLLRNLQKEIDETVLAAYGWNDLQLEHGFYELEFLPENDRTRYTVSNDARREILQRLLVLNHERHKEEFNAGLVDEKGKPLKKKSKKGKNNYTADAVHDSSFLFDANDRDDLF